MKLTIFSRLVIGYIIIFGMVAVANIYAIDQLRRFNKVTRSVLVADNRMLDLQKKLSDSLLAQMRFEKKFLLVKDDVLYKQFLAAKANFDEDLKQAMMSTDCSETKKLLLTVGRAQLRYESLVSEEVAHLRHGQPYDQSFYRKVKERAATEAVEGLRQLREYSRQSIYDKVKRLDVAVATSHSLAFIMIVTSLLLGIMTSIVITRSIAKPLFVMKKKTQEVAQGNFDSTVTLASPPEIAELAGAFNLMCERLQKLDKMKSDFVSMMSHELRTPLTSIKEGTNLLLEGVGGTVTDQQKRLLKIISEEDTRLIDLVNSLLDLSKMEVGMMTYNFEPGDLMPVIRRVVREIEPLARAKHITFEGQVHGEVPPIKMDAERICQALRNLVSNAIKFTPNGGRVGVVLRMNERAVEVSVSDTGPGIPEEQLELIFDKYHQVTDAGSKQTKGTGLGLTIVKHIITAHGGAVWAKSKPGQGSTFTFSLQA